MSDTTGSLSHKINSAGELKSVVRTMKALAASSVGQYEQAVLALADYDRAVQLGLSVCLRDGASPPPITNRSCKAEPAAVAAIVFGSDQGLVGQFNEVIADFAIKTLAGLPGKPQVWAVGERVRAHLTDAGVTLLGQFEVPNSVQGITPLVGQIQTQTESKRAKMDDTSLYVFHNRPKVGALYEPVSQRVLPLDAEWQHDLASLPWPTKLLPEVVGDGAGTLRACLREYLFISLFRACAESLAGENASRLAAMQRADKNIDELLATLHGTFHRLRQTNIDEELFDVISGFEALTGPRKPLKAPARGTPPAPGL